MRRKSFQIFTHSETESIGLGKIIGQALRPSDMVLMIGDLGSGKTTMAKGIVSGATGVPTEEVVSPTFTLVNRYEGEPPVHHVDLYRIESHQIEGIGLEYAFEEEAALVIEWAEKLSGFQEESLSIQIDYAVDEQTREILFKWSEEGAWDDRMKIIISGFEK